MLGHVSKSQPKSCTSVVCLQDPPEAMLFLPGAPDADAAQAPLPVWDVSDTPCPAVTPEPPEPFLPDPFAFRRLAVDIVDSGGQTTVCEYVLHMPLAFESQPPANGWPALLFIPGHAEIDRIDRLQGLGFGCRSGLLSSFALEHFVIIVPVLSRSNPLCRHRHVNASAVWMLFMTALFRLGSHVDHRRLYITGYSMGADAAAQIAANHGSVLAGVALFAGQYQQFWKTAKLKSAAAQFCKLAVRATHNLSDEYIDPQNTRELVEWLRSNVCEKSQDDTQWHCQEAVDLRAGVSSPYESKAQNFVVDVCTFDEGRKTMHLVRDGLVIGAEGGDVIEKRGHLCWPPVYRNEDAFGLFHWFLQHQSAAQIGFDVLLEVELARPVCCLLPHCPVAELGFPVGKLHSSDASSTILTVGVAEEIHHNSPVQLWNLQQSLGGHRERQILPGDCIVCVNDISDDPTRMVAELSSRREHFKLVLLKQIHLFADSSGLLPQCHTKNVWQDSVEYARSLVEWHRRCGDFAWVVCAGHPVCMNDPTVTHWISPSDLAWFRRTAEVERKWWLSSLKCLQWMCRQSVREEYLCKQAMLIDMLPMAWQKISLEHAAKSFHSGHETEALYQLQCIEDEWRAFGQFVSIAEIPNLSKYIAQCLGHVCWHSGLCWNLENLHGVNGRSNQGSINSACTCNEKEDRAFVLGRIPFSRVKLPLPISEAEADVLARRRARMASKLAPRGRASVCHTPLNRRAGHTKSEVTSVPVGSQVATELGDCPLNEALSALVVCGRTWMTIETELRL